MRLTRRQFSIGAVLVAALPECKGAGMSANRKSFEAIIERGFCQGDLSIADEICAKKMVEHEYLAKAELPGPQILKAQIEEARHSFREFKLTIEAIVETSDTIWARSKATGLDPRSGKPIAIYVIDICRFHEGKLVKHWGVPDRFALLHQIGALTPTKQPAQ